VAKILLVEDDNNLREIYEARLAAEGYDIVTAQNGEEALVVAKQNKPDLVISDVMMPRISGFEMLDILRNTDELRDIKVIMLTALGQSDDQARADKLGANKYLVKSQVTLEDIVNAAKELLGEGAATETPATPEAPETASVEATTPAEEPQAVVATPAAPESSMPEVVPAPAEVTPAPETAPETQIASTPSVDTPAETVEAPAPQEALATPEMPVAETPAPEAPEPTPVEPAAPAEAPTEPVIVAPEAQTMASEEATVEDQINTFANTAPVEPADPTSQETTTQPVPSANPESTVSTNQENLINEAVKDLTQAVNAPPEPALPPSQKPAPDSDPALAETPAPEMPETPASSPTEPQIITPQMPPNDGPAVNTSEPVSMPPAPVAAETVPPTPAESVTPPPTPGAPTSPETTTPDNEFQQVSGKKVIQPISGENTRPNLDELLAREEATAGTEAPAPEVGDVAQQPEQPQQPQAEQKTGSGVDPNSIAL